MRFRLSLFLVLAAAIAVGCGNGGEKSDPEALSGTGVKTNDPGPIHVHGLGINPADKSLFIATHTGLFRAAPGEENANRVGDRFQDTMGFTISGPDRFLGSGHPDGRDRLPPFLGLIRSANAGESWDPISLLGKSDFHVLEARGTRVYGFGSDFDTRKEQLLVSDDGGREWRKGELPESLIALAIDPQDPDQIIASGPAGLHRSEDAARNWERFEGPPGLVGWHQDGRLYSIGADGSVNASDSDGGSWRTVGQIDGQPAAFEVEGDDLYVALHDGTIKRSDDNGRTWAVRSKP